MILCMDELLDAIPSIFKIERALRKFQPEAGHAAPKKFARQNYNLLVRADQMRERCVRIEIQRDLILNLPHIELYWELDMRLVSRLHHMLLLRVGILERVSGEPILRLDGKVVCLDFTDEVILLRSRADETEERLRSVREIQILNILKRS